MTQPNALPTANHRITLDRRESLRVDGVTEVVSFDDTTVLLKTTQGTLLVGGQDLKLRTLTLEGGQVAVDGTVSLLQYEDIRPQGGFFRRLFG